MAFNSEGTRMLTASNDTLFLWDLTDGELISTMAGHSGACKPIGFSHNGMYFFTFGLADSSIRVWEAWSGVNTRTYKPYFLSPSTAVIAPDGQHIIAGYRDGALLSLYVGDALSAPREQDMPHGLTVQCFPNPIARNSVITFKSDKQEPVNIEVYNNLGVKISEIVEGVVSPEEHSLFLSDICPLNNLASGAYLLSIITPRERRTITLHLLR